MRVRRASEHKDGRAWDWMLNHANKADRRAAANFLGWITADNGAMAARLGIMYVIFNRKIWASYSPGWRNYTGADPHTSHIHISLSWNGARAHTSFWTGNDLAARLRLLPGLCRPTGGVADQAPSDLAVRPPAAPAIELHSTALLWLGSTGPSVGKAQRLLGMTATRTFDRATRRAVCAYQAAHELPRTGALDDPTWASLSPASIKSSKPAWTAGSRRAMGCTTRISRGASDRRRAARSMPCNARCGCRLPCAPATTDELPALAVAGCEGAAGPAATARVTPDSLERRCLCPAKRRAENSTHQSAWSRNNVRHARPRSLPDRSQT